jgi:hypothetical protein
MLSTIDITDIAESRTIEPAILYFRRANWRLGNDGYYC